VRWTGDASGVAGVVAAALGLRAAASLAAGVAAGVPVEGLAAVLEHDAVAAASRNAATTRARATPLV
jgi:hypothetical protein